MKFVVTVCYEEKKYYKIFDSNIWAYHLHHHHHVSYVWIRRQNTGSQQSPDHKTLIWNSKVQTKSWTHKNDPTKHGPHKYSCTSNRHTHRCLTSKAACCIEVWIKPSEENRYYLYPGSSTAWTEHWDVLLSSHAERIWAANHTPGAQTPHSVDQAEQQDVQHRGGRWETRPRSLMFALVHRVC